MESQIRQTTYARLIPVLLLLIAKPLCFSFLVLGKGFICRTCEVLFGTESLLEKHYSLTNHNMMSQGELSAFIHLDHALTLNKVC